MENPYLTVKVPLQKVLKHYDLIFPRLESTVLRVNEFAHLSSDFLQLYLLHKFQLHQPLPQVNKAFLTRIFNLLGKRDPRGRKSQVVNDDLQQFYQDHFSPLYPQQPSKAHLSYVLPLLAEEMIRGLETNLKTHFHSYLYKYVNLVLKQPLLKEIKLMLLTKEEKKFCSTQINQQMKKIKFDLLDGEIITAEEPYHSWIEEQDKLFFPFVVAKSHAYYLQKNPQHYLFSALLINQKIEELGKRPYQVIPQRKGLVPQHITLNTSGMVEVLADHQQEIYRIGYSEMNNHAKKYQHHVWQEILKLENRGIFQHKKHLFFHQIQTDGVSVSLLFINKKYYHKKYGDRLPPAEIVSPMKKLTDLSKKECQKYKGKTLIGIDPGKKTLLTMKNKEGKSYSYSTSRRRWETYTQRSQQILLSAKQKEGIITLETTLSSKKGRTVDVTQFRSYLQRKQEMITPLQNFYQNILWRKLALRRFIRTQSSQQKMLNEIERCYGKNLLLGLGNWSNNQTGQMKGCLPSPHRGLGKLLTQRFLVLEVDEFRTSKLYARDPTQELVKLKVRRGKRKLPLHAVLTLTGKPNGVIVNRDQNAASNILMLFESYLHHQIRPAAFCRPGHI